MTIRLLHVDDDPNEQMLLRYTLGSITSDLALENASSVDDALVKLKSESYDCIVCDYQMPGKDGIELLREIRHQKKKVPFIFLTGQGSEDVAAAALREGANGYYPKNTGIAFGERLYRSIINSVESFQREKELEQKRQHLSAFFDGSSALIFICDQQGIILQVNSQLCLVTGFSEEEFLGNSLTEFILLPSGKETFMEELNQAALEKKLSYEMCFYRKYGTDLPMEVAISTIEVAEGKQFVGIGRDISKRKKREERLRILTQAIDQNQASIVITDDKGDIEYVNPAFCTLTGYSEEESLGKNPSILKSGDLSPEDYAELWQKITSGKVWSGQFHNKKKNGESYWENATISPVYNDEGVIAHFVAVKDDITDKKFMEETLAQEKQRLEYILKGTDIGTWEWNVKTGESTFNEKCIELLGHSYEELSFGSFLIREDYVVQEDLVDAVSALKDHLSGEEEYFHCDLRVYNKSYDLVWIRVRGKLLVAHDDETQMMYGTITDITTSRKKEQLKEHLFILSQEASKLSMKDTLIRIIDAAEAITESNLGFFSLLHDGEISEDAVFSSQTLKYQKTKGTFITRALTNSQVWEECLKTGEIEVNNNCKSNSEGKAKSVFEKKLVVPIIRESKVEALLVLADKIGDYKELDIELIKTLSNSAMEILARKISEAEVRKSEERYRAIFQKHKDSIIIKEYGTNYILDVNEATLRTYQYSKEDLVGRESFILSAEPEKTKNVNAKAMEHGIHEVPHRMHRKKDGTEFPVSSYAIPITLEGKQCLFVVITDITEQEEAKKRLKISEEKLEEFVANAPIGLFITTPDGKFVLANQAMCDIFGYESIEEMKNSKLSDDMEFGKGKTRSDFINDVRRDGWLKDQQYEFKRRDGSQVFVKETAKGHFDENGELAFIEGTIEDITEKIMYESEMAQAEKLQAIGQLASGIAHEINTPMQYISDNINFLSDLFKGFQQELKDVEEISGEKEAGKGVNLEGKFFKSLMEEFPEAIEDTVSGIETVTKIVRSMKVFSHPGGQNKQKADIHDLIQSTVRVSKNEWKYVADLELDLDEEMEDIVCYPREFNQVILNMIINGKHAIEKSIEKGIIEKGKIKISTSFGKDYATIKIEDNGCGIPEEIQSRVFEPFFTTKGIGKGTGQGLAISYDIIVKKHEGKILLDSKVDKGTTFTIKLPLIEEELENEDIIG